MSEDDAHLQTLYRMSETETVVLTPPSAGTKEEQHRRIVEYYSDFNVLSVLNDAIGQPSRRRLVQVDLPGPQAGSVKWRELSRLDDIDRAYLAQRRVHELPSKAHWFVVSCPFASSILTWCHQRLSTQTLFQTRLPIHPSSRPRKPRTRL